MGFPGRPEEGTEGNHGCSDQKDLKIQVYIEGETGKDCCNGVYVLKKDASADFFLDFKLLHQCVGICAQYIIVAYLYSVLCN